MNTNLGLMGEKLGNTQFFDNDGAAIRVTAIRTQSCVVVGKRTQDKDGYSALCLGYGDKPERLLNKPQAGQFKKIGVTPVRTVKEFRLPEDVVAKYEVGQALKPSDVFTEGQKVDVMGQTKGRGFTGVMKRWNFRGAGSDTHGTHEYRRHGGSIGTNMTPGRTFPNQKMGGQYGNEQVTIQNLKVAKLLDEEGIVLIEGAVPGARYGIVTVRGTVKSPPKTAS